ncbi:Cullin repeat-like-containing domain protein [Boletus edulis BED1]|uniref:Cullin repeat-like-containing domain protein n=1 Tax=Boletus edulis BED1 TaxID=1328754 RepID=A0AAD4BF90_BOLED|nr:Cullin repeat-like-containing domain protein [Boletus edulis BED1]
MDDESAEIELLEQNLNKTHQISHRSVLTNFDSRLVKLEKSILPLYAATDIDCALFKIDEVASSHEGIAEEEGLILRGPEAGQLEMYIDTLARLNAAIAFKSSDEDAREKARLLETSAKKLTQLYTKLVAEGSSGSPPIAGLDFTPATFPPALLASLKPLVAVLRGLPLPSTHPSHPAGQLILYTLKEAQRGYADMRGSWNRKSLEMHAKRVVDRADTLDGVIAGKEFGTWVGNLLRIAEILHPSLLASTYDTLLNPLLTLFTDTLSSLTAIIKRSLHKYTFHALAAYSALSPFQSRWETIMTWRGEGSVCLRTFPEFLADLKLAAAGPGKGGELGVSLADFTVSVNRIPEVQEAVRAALLALGDGNWKMREGKQIGKAQKVSTIEMAEKLVLQHYTFDIVNTTVNSFTALSQTQRRGAFGSIFLLNNISYFYSRLVLKPTHPGLIELVTKPTADALTSAFRTAKAGYFDANFSPLMQALITRGKRPPRKNWGQASDSEGVGGRGWEEGDAEEAVKLVVPSLQRFIQKQRDKEFSKSTAFFCSSSGIR